jgi:hypothetical protein
MDIADIVIEVLEEAKQRIQDNMAAKDINASGRTSRSFRVERYNGGVLLVMGGTGEPTAPLETLEVGRPAGPIPSNMTDILVQWSRDKGIPFDRESQRRSFAYLLGRRIEREGTLRHKHNEDIYTTVVMETAESIVGEVTVAVTKKIHEQLRQ